MRILGLLLLAGAAKLLQDAGTPAFKAAKAKDLAKLTELNGQMYEACAASPVTTTIARTTESVR